MEDKFEDILRSVAARPPRSRLESYAELIDELRRRELTYRQIARILTEKCHIRVPKSTVNDFVRPRNRRRRNAARQVSRRAAASTPVVSKSAANHSSERPSDAEVQQRIAAVKARKPASTSSANDFHFDPDEPLRLIDPEK